MNKRMLNPAALRVESFSTGTPADKAHAAAEALARTRVGPECFPSSDRTCTC